MKKMYIVLGLAAIAGSVYAACMGPFCYDDRGAYVAGTIQDGNGSGMPSLTVAQEQSACPRAAGQEIFCSNCSANGGLGTVCISTGTTCVGTNNFDYVLSTGTKCL